MVFDFKLYAGFMWIILVYTYVKIMYYASQEYNAYIYYIYTETLLRCKLCSMSSNSKSTIFLTKCYNIAHWLKMEVETEQTQLEPQAATACDKEQIISKF